MGGPGSTDPCVSKSWPRPLVSPGGDLMERRVAVNEQQQQLCSHSPGDPVGRTEPG